MKKQIFFIIILLFLLISFSSCIFTTTGESLEAFSRRMNEINEVYNMTSEGYIADTEKSELTKYFRFSEKEIMLNFKYDEKNRLNEMNIVFDADILAEYPDSSAFICDCISCFIQNEEAESLILNETDFENSVRKINMQTISAEADNIKMEIDTTQLGTVVSVYKDI